MADSAPLRKTPTGTLRIFVELLTLTTFAVAQSVYQAVSGNREFVVLNRLTHADLFWIVVCFNLVPALVLTAIWGVLRWRNQQWADLFLSASFLLLLTPFLFELHRTFLSPLLRFSHNTILILIPLAVAACVVFFYRAEFEQFLRILSPVVVVFPVLFLSRSWKQVLPIISPTSDQARQASAAVGNKPLPPIFIVILDEFTRPALLDGRGNIDAVRFPHFAELAQGSTWFTNATANADYTTYSIPVIVTGNFAKGQGVPEETYRKNLFRLLAPQYDITIHEVVTRFCDSPSYHCPDLERIEQRSYLIPAVLKLYLLRIATKSVVLAIQAHDIRLEQQRFDEFLNEISPSAARPVLYFMHLELPHAPYMLRPDGSIDKTTPNGFDERYAGDVPLLQRLRNDYECQIGFVDRQLGDFLGRLKQTVLYDQSLIIVTSDHGVSWKSAAPGRTLTEANADMIFPVPLFIKLPNQPQGQISGQDVQSIDLVPTIAAITGIHLTWSPDGRDIYAPGATSREKIMYAAGGRKFAYPANFAETVPDSPAR